MLFRTPVQAVDAALRGFEKVRDRLDTAVKAIVTESLELLLRLLDPINVLLVLLLWIWITLN